jgi:putative transposase
VEWYNNRPHESLPLRGDGEHFTPAQFRRYKLEKEAEIEWLSELSCARCSCRRLSVPSTL